MPDVRFDNGLAAITPPDAWELVAEGLGQPRQGLVGAADQAHRGPDRLGAGLPGADRNEVEDRKCG